MSDNKVLYGEEDRPEVVREFDADTGEEFNDSTDSVYKLQEDRAVFESRSLEEMTKSAGWKLIEEFLITKLDSSTDLLIREQDMNQVIKHQASIQSFQGLLNFIASKIQEGKQFTEENQNGK